MDTNTHIHTRISQIHAYKLNVNTNVFTLRMKEQGQQRHYSRTQVAFHFSLFCFTSYGLCFQRVAMSVEAQLVDV